MRPHLSFPTAFSIRLKLPSLAVDRKCMDPESSPRAGYSIDRAAGVVLAAFRGDLTFSDIAGYACALAIDPQFNPALAEIVDLRHVTSVTLSAPETLELADGVDPFSFRSRRAFVVESQAQMRAAHLHRILRPENDTIRIFSSVHDARTWIASRASLKAKASP